MITRTEKSEQIMKEWELEEAKKAKQKKILKYTILISVIVLVVFGSFSYMRFVGTSGLFIREYRVVNKNLPSSFHGLKIIHFSDLHYNSTFYKEDLIKLVKKINQLRPDLVVFTGDLTDKDTVITEEDQKFLKEQLSKIETHLGAYAIRGNHDYQTNHFDIIFTNTQFKILDNNYDLIYSKGTEPILLTGVGSTMQNDLNIEQAFSLKTEQPLFTITLLHEPDTITDILKNHTVDLALAGHSHNGQIRIPGLGAIYSVTGAKKYPNEYYKISKTDLFVSGGLGTSKYKLRLFDHPSINLYRVVQK